MSILDIFRKGVRTIDKVTKPLHGTVTFKKYTGGDGEGTKNYASAVSMKAIVDWRQTQVRTSTGIMSMSRASVIFLDIDALLAATNNLGVDDNDIITLPDGTTGPILSLSGFIDAGTTQPLATEVFLG